MNYRVFSRHVILGMCLLLLSSFCFGEDPEIIADVKQIIYSSPFRSYMHKYPKLLAYSEKRDIPMNRIESVIIDHIRDIIDGREKVILSPHIAINTLSGFRSERAISTLKELSGQVEGSWHHDAMSALITIGGNDLLSFARNVMEDDHQFSALDRFWIFEGMWKRYLRDDRRSDTTVEFRSGISDFLIASIYSERDPANISSFDERLIRTNDKYRRSKQREALLKKYESTQNDAVRKYFAEELAKLQRITKKNRTDISVKQLANVRLVPKKKGEVRVHDAPVEEMSNAYDAPRIDVVANKQKLDLLSASSRSTDSVMELANDQNEAKKEREKKVLTEFRAESNSQVNDKSMSRSEAPSKCLSQRNHMALFVVAGFLGVVAVIFLKRK